MKLGQLRAGMATHGRITWVNSRSGAISASVNYAADMCDPDDACVRLSYTTRSSVGTVDQYARIDLTTTRPHFRGLRWWFVCPLSGDRVRCLHLAPSGRFAGRQHLRLGYGVQRETWTMQRLRAARVIDAKLGGAGWLDDDPPPKPKWMRWPTYWRLVEQRERASLASLIGMTASLNRAGRGEIIDNVARTDPGLLSGSGLL